MRIAFVNLIHNYFSLCPCIAAMDDFSKIETLFVWNVLTTIYHLTLFTTTPQCEPE